MWQLVWPIGDANQYKGICERCREYGHHSRKPPQNKPFGFRFQVGNNESGETCYYCGEKRHCVRDEELSGQEGSQIDQDIWSKRVWKFCSWRGTIRSYIKIIKASMRLDFNQDGSWNTHFVLDIISYTMFKRYIRLVDTKKKIERDQLITIMMYGWCMSDNYARTKVYV